MRDALRLVRISAIQGALVDRGAGCEALARLGVTGAGSLSVLRFRIFPIVQARARGRILLALLNCINY